MPQGTIAKGCLNIFSEKLPLFIITLAPHSPVESYGGLGVSTLLRAVGGGKVKTWRLLSGGHAWPRRVGRTPLLSGNAVCVHLQRQTCGAADRDKRGSRFLQQDPSDKRVLALLSPMTINPLLGHEPLPWVPCSETKGPFRECQSATG